MAAPLNNLIARVVDFETIGFDPHPYHSGICEVGYCDVLTGADGGDPVWSDPVGTLCHPGCAIPPTASAIHHITDDMVAGEPPAESIVREVFAPDIVKVAHNAKFEQKFYNPIGQAQRWICTWKCAHRLWPTAPGFGNHALRYWLGLKLDAELWRPAHRAGPDAYTTANILIAMLQTGANIEELIEWSDQPVLLITVGFGKHQGMPWSEVPEDYLRWLTNNANEKPDSWDEDTVHTAWHYLKIATGQLI